MLHTELFTTYIANNGGADSALPSLFKKVPNITNGDEVTTFQDSFVLNFCDREIGFETEALFALKLEGRAKLVLPRYINKLETLAKIDYLSAERTESETRTSTAKTKDSGTDKVTREGSGSTTDSGTDKVAHETSGSTTDSGKDTVTRFNGENPLINTTAVFNTNAISAQEQATTEYGKTSTAKGSGSDSTTYGKSTKITDSGTDSTVYGKVTDNTLSDNVTRKYTHDATEAYALYEKVLNERLNIWSEIFKEFDSLFMAIW